MQKIFISYSRKDIDFVRMLAKDLGNVGFKVWWDIPGLLGGSVWIREIPKAIKSSRYVIVVLTPASKESEWVKKEIAEALSLRKRIVPIILHPCDIPFELKTINPINFSIGEYKDNLSQLLSSFGNTGKLTTASTEKDDDSSQPRKHLKYGILPIIGLVLLLVLVWVFGYELPREPTPTNTSRIINTLLTSTQSSVTAAIKTISPTIMLISVPTEIIITYFDGHTTIHSCPSSDEPAMLSAGGKVDLELSATMKHDDFEKLEWWNFVSASKEKFGIGKTASYSSTSEGGIIYVILNESIICTLNIQ